MAKMAIKQYEDVQEKVKEIKDKQISKEENNQTNQVVTEMFTCRINKNVVDALRKAAVDRKVAKKPIASQQQIVEAAIATWLKQNGYELQ